MPTGISRLQAVLFLAALTQWYPAFCEAADADAEDNAPPECKFCPQDTGSSGWVEGGIGYQNEDDYHFGRYTGFDEKGALLNGSGAFRYRGEDGTFVDGEAQNLGVESRRFELQGGTQGKYEIGIEYDQIPNFRERSSFSPFIGLGSGTYGLPSNWVAGSTTDSMPNLATDLRRVPLKTERDRTGAKFSLYPGKRWEVSGYARHEKKDGVRDTGATFGFTQTVYLPVSFEYQTDEFGVSLGYTGERFQSQLSYTGSLFNNDRNAIIWRNPYQDATSNTAWGRLAEKPDNAFHQISALLGYQWSADTRLSARLARGRMTQDQNFLPYTINPGITASPLPASNLDGRVDTTLASLEIDSRVLPRLRLNGSYTYSDRDNKTDVNVYDYVVTDTGPGGMRQNRPYSYKQQLLRLKAAYRFPKQITLSGGYDDDEMKRTYVQAEKTRDKTLWAKLAMRPLEMLETSLKYSYSDRNASSYIPLSQINPLLDNPNPNFYDNPLMRVLIMADRTRDKIGFTLSLTPVETLTFGLDYDYVLDSYDKMYLGLHEAKGSVATASLSYTFSENLSASAYYTYDYLTSDQKGSQKLFYTDPENPWVASSQNRTDTTGVSLTWSPMPDKLDLGADLTYSEFTGEIGFVDSTALPDISSRLRSLNIHATYRLSERLSLRAEYLYEKFTETDWSKDGAVNTLPTLLSLGTAPQDSSTYLGFVSLRYEF